MAQVEEEAQAISTISCEDWVDSVMETDEVRVADCIGVLSGKSPWPEWILLARDGFSWCRQG